jgi:O-antigen/teichoic acid export membrane protein
VQPAYRDDFWVNDTLPLPVFDGRPPIHDRRVQVPPHQPPAPESQNWPARILAGLRDPVYRGSYALVANTMGTSVIGAVYWAVAAHLFSPVDLGRATALISGLMLVATLSQLNLSNTLMRFLPQLGARSASRLINATYLVSALTAVAGSVIFITVLPRLSSEWRFVGDSAFFAVFFAVSVVVWEIFTLQDAALVGLQRAVAVPIENVIYSLAKLVLLVVGVRVLGSTDVLFSWIIPLIFLIPGINWLIFRRCLKDRRPHDLVPHMRVRQFARFASVDYAGVVCSQITANSLPVLVISVLGPAAAGSFYIASLITSGVASVGISFATGLMVEATAAPNRLPEITRGALKRCVLTMGPATIALFFGARLILRVYGGAYIAQTAVLFQLLALTLLPFCIETVAYSLDRIAGKPIRSTLSQLAIAILTLGGSWILFGRLGLNAVGVACLGADTVVALVRLPTVLAALRRRPGVIAQPARPAQQPVVPASPAPDRRVPASPAPDRRVPASPAPDRRAPASPAPDRPQRQSERRNYAGRHRATGSGKPPQRDGGDVRSVR